MNYITSFKAGVFIPLLAVLAIGYNASADGATEQNNPIAWQTNRASLMVDDFYITANGARYLGNGAQLSSDPGDPTYATFESKWMENGREMRLYIYFQADSTHWWANEIDTYDGQLQGDWVTYKGRFFESPLGQPFNGNLDLASGNNAIHLSNLKLLVHLQ